MGNARVVKRKNNSVETKIEPVRKALKKNELLVQFNVLEKKYETLEREHNLLIQQEQKNLEAISMLEETVQLLENVAAGPPVETESVTVQTEIMRCEECEFPAFCMSDLIDHMHEFHPLQQSEPEIECRYCGVLKQKVSS